MNRRIKSARRFVEERMMKIEVEFGNGEAALLGAILGDHADELRERWEVETMDDLVKLLAMHGADNLDTLVG